MNAAARYLDGLVSHVGRLATDAAEAMELAAERMARSITAGGVVHVFGTGHSQLVASELSERAAGLAAVHPIVDPGLSPAQGRRAAATERLAGYGEVILGTEDLRTGEVLVVVSNSGLNAVPIEVAIGARDRGLFVIAVTSRAQSSAAPSRHASGRRLADVADLTIDTGSPAGDGALTLDDGSASGPLSTILSAAVLHAIASRVAELLVDMEGAAPVLVSQNLDVADDVNAELFSRYADRKRS